MEKPIGERSFIEKLTTLGQVSVPQAIAEMAYNGNKCDINHSLIYNIIIQIYKWAAKNEDDMFKL